MADKSKILSADAEAALLKPIDEYVGKIQSQIDALRVDGSVCFVDRGSCK